MTSRLAAAAILTVAYLFLHLPVGDVFDFLAARFGFEPYDRVTLLVFVALGAIGLGSTWRLPADRRAVVGSAATVLGTLMVAAQSFLVVASIENIHYLQYALLFLVLLWAPLGLETAWIATVALGGIDELYQFLALPRGRPDYFDWNDVVLNALGACLGALVVLAMSNRWDPPRSSVRAVGAVIAVLVGTAFVLDPPVLSPFYSYTPGGRPFHKLSAAEAVAIAAVLWVALRKLLLTESAGEIVRGSVDDRGESPAKRSSPALDGVGEIQRDDRGAAKRARQTRC